MKKRFLLGCFLMLVVCLTFAMGIFSISSNEQVFADVQNETLVYATDGRVPPQQDYYSLANSYPDYSAKYDGSTLGSYYCMRDEYMLYAQQQSVQGLCWDFASNMALSTTIMKSTGQFLDFSEGWISLAMAYGANTGDFTTYINNFESSYYPGNGGWFMGFDQAAKRYGLLLEQEFDYEQSYLISMSNYSNLYSEYSQYANHNIMQNVTAGRFNYYMNKTTEVKTKTINSIKQHVKNNGAVAASLRWQDMMTFSYKGKSLICKTPGQNVSTGHLVSIIGWDDNISCTYNSKTYKGAWIVLNSYGNEIHDTCGDEGIIYIFYDDANYDAHFWGYEYNTTITGDNLYLRPSIQSSNASYTTDLAGAYYGSFVSTTSPTKQKNIFYGIDDINLVYSYTTSSSTSLDKIEIFCKGEDVTNDFAISYGTNKVTITSTNSPIGAYRVAFTYSNASSSEQTESCFYICDGAEINYMFSQIEDNCHGTVTNNKKFLNYNNLNFFDDEFFFATSVQSGIILFKLVFTTYSEITSVTPTTTGVYFNSLQNEQIIGQISYNLATRDTYSFILRTSSGISRTIDFKFTYKSTSSYEWANVFYETNGGQNSDQNEKMELVSTSTGATLENPTKPGYDFAGWYYDKNFTSKLPQSGGKYYIQYSKLKTSSGSKGWSFSDQSIYYGKDVYICVYAKWTKKAAESVAKIYSGGVWTNYATLEQAVEASTSGDTIFLTNDYTLESQISTTKTLTIVSDNNATLYIGTSLGGKQAINISNLSLGSSLTTLNGRTLTKFTIDGNKANVLISSFLNGTTFVMYDNVVIQNCQYSKSLIKASNITMYGGVIQNNIYNNSVDSGINSVLRGYISVSVLGTSSIINNEMQAGGMDLISSKTVTCAPDITISGNETLSVISATNFYPNGVTIKDNSVVYGALYINGSSVDLTNITVEAQTDVYLGYSDCEVLIGPNTNISVISFSLPETYKYNIKVTQSLLSTQKIKFLFPNGKVSDNYLTRDGEYPIITLASGATISEDNFGFVTNHISNGAYEETDDYSIVKGTTTATQNNYYVKETLNFTYNLNYTGSSAIVQSYAYGETIVPIANPTREGYVFKGWYIEASCINAYSFGTMPANDVTVYAKWELATFIITSSASTGGTISPVGTSTCSYGSSKTFTFTANTGYQVSNIKIDGVALTGTNLTNAINDGYTFTNIAADHTIYVEFSVRPYMFIYNLNYTGTTNIVKTYNYGQTISKITDPTRTGYTFAGWYKEANCTNVYSFGTMPAKSVTVYAKWTIKNYTITSSAGTGGTISPSGTSTCSYGSSKTFTFSPNAGYQVSNIKIDGVALTGGNLTNAINNGYTFTNIAANHTIYVEFSALSYTFTYNLNYSGATNVTNTYIYGQTIAKIENPTRQGYSFGGWYKESTCVNAYSFGTMPSYNVTVYAKWTKQADNCAKIYSGGVWTNYTTLEQAVAAATSGDIIFLTKDYTLENPIFSNKTLTIVSDNNATLYIGASLNNIDTAININNLYLGSTQSVINGLTLTPFKIDGSKSSVTVKNFLKGTSLTIYDNVTIQNFRYINSLIEFDNIIMNGGLIQNNSFYTDTNLIHCLLNSNSNLTVTGTSTITNNTIEGGSLFLLDGANVTLSSTITISGNQTSSVVCANTFYPNGVVIKNNTAFYGAIYLNSTTVDLTDITVEATTDIYLGLSDCQLLIGPKTNISTIHYPGSDIRTYNIKVVESLLPTQKINLLFKNGTVDEKYLVLDGSYPTITLANSATISESNFGFLLNSKVDDVWEETTKYSLVRGTKAETLNNYYVRAYFNIYYHTNYTGGPTYDQSLAYGTKIVKIEDPVREGYTFVNWYNDETLSTPYVFGIMPVNDVHVYAKWQINTYKITASAATGGTISPSGVVLKDYNTNQTFTFSSNIGYDVDKIKVDGVYLSGTQLQNAIKNGYTFSAINKDHTISVEFKTIKYVFTYNFNYEGVENLTYDYDYGQTITKIANPTRQGYSFGGWYKEASCVNAYSFGTMPAYDVTVYAKWTVLSFTISASSSSNGSISPTGYITKKYGESQKFTFKPSTGYFVDKIFVDGVSLDEEQLQNAILNGYTFTNILSNHTIYVEFSTQYYTFTYNLNYEGAEDITQSYAYNEKITKIATPQREGYNFVNWYADKNCTTIYTFSRMPANDVTVYAKWTIKTYTITTTVSGNGSVSPSGKITKNHGESITISISPQLGFAVGLIAVNGSSLTATQMQDAVANGLTISDIVQNYTISVVFEAIMYNFTYDLNYEGSQNITAQIKCGQMVALIPNPTRQGYTFGGWYQEKECINTFTLVMMPPNDVTVYAKWTINTYTITATAGANGTIDPIGEKIVNFGESVTYTFKPEQGYLVKYIEVDYNFLTAAELASAVQDGYTFENISKSHKIHVEFEVVAYILTYNLNYPNCTNITQNYDYGEKITKIPDPTRNGYDFVGWYEERACLNEYEFSTMPASDVMVYAKWYVKSYTIIASAGENGNISPSGEISATYGEDLLFIFEPNPGYCVKTIVVDGAELLPEQLESAITNGYWFGNIEQNHTIYVEFDLATFVFVYDHNYLGSENITLPIVYGEVIENYQPTREGYDFAGWYEEEECINVYEITTMPANDVTVYAKWNIKTYIITVVVGGNGNTSPSGEVPTNHGESLTIMFEPNYGYQLKSLTVDEVQLSISEVEYAKTNGYTFVDVTQAHTIVVEFEDITYEFVYNLNYEETECITQRYIENAIIDKIPDPTRKGYTFEGWYCEQECVTQYVFETMPNYNVTVYAKWERITYVVTATAGENGKITPEGENVVNQGDNITFTISPNAGYEIQEIRIDGQKPTKEQFVEIAKNLSYTFENVHSQHSISVVFKILTYEITATVLGNGTITPMGISELFEDQSITYVFEPSVGYYVSKLKIDGIALFDIESNTYTFSNVKADHTIVVEFVVQRFEIEVDADGGCRVGCEQGLTEIAYGDSRTIMFYINSSTEIKSVTVDGKQVECVDNKIVVENIQKDMLIVVKTTEKVAVGTLIIILGLVALVVAGGVIAIVLRGIKHKPRKEQLRIEELRQQMEKYNQKNDQNPK